MKKTLIKVMLAVTMVTLFSTVISCRNNSTDVEHHSESGRQEDNAVDNPSTAPTTDSTQTGPATGPATPATPSSSENK